MEKTFNLEWVNMKTSRGSRKDTRNPAGIYLRNVNNKTTRKRCEICSKLTIRIREGCY